ncbi:MAG: T9SS type A sorting domain-containing protein, partial [Bacteroidales bacterium]|nr:T9SS type A sorting domain-containing protein [Bacteroidales bacterium]
SPGALTVVASGGGGSGTYTYLWYRNGASIGVTSSTYNPGPITVNTDLYCVVTSTSCGSVTTPTFTIVVLSAVWTPTPITISAGTEPTCQLTNGTTTTTYSTTATNNTGFNWTISNPDAGSINSSGVMTWADGFYGTVVIQVTANGCEGPTIMVTHTVVVNQGASIGSVTGPTPLCIGSPETFTANSVILGGGTGSWSSNNITIATVDAFGVVTPIAGGSCDIIYTITGACGNPVSAQQSVYVYETTSASVNISVSPGTLICEGTLVTFTANGTNGGTSPLYEWFIDGNPVGSNSSTFSSSTLAMGNMISCKLTSNKPCVTGSPVSSNTINMIVKPSLTAEITISTPSNPACTNSLVTFYTSIEDGGTTPAYQWYVNGTLQTGATNSTYSANNLGDGNTVSCVLNSNEACVVNNPANSNVITMVISPVPEANAGNDATYSGTPVLLGSPLNGPGTITWTPQAGLDNPSSQQPYATPTYTTVYTLSVNNDGCVRTDDVVVTVAGSGYMVSGKTMYAYKALAGNPAPTPPTFNPLIYNINKVIVILKNQTGTELARDTTDIWGTYSFNNVSNGNYILSYDKYTVDTMMWVNEVNAVDIALVKYYVSSTPAIDPSRSFMTIHKRAANVDNNGFTNAIDIARLKAKVADPYNPAKNFPKGNWVNLDSLITVSNANLSVNLPVIAYGDYNASSSKYKDSANTWGLSKSLPIENIVMTSEDAMVTVNKELIEVPLRISGKVNEFSALGLELTYSNDEYELVTAGMPKAGKDNESITLNPSLDEIIANDKDLLVTESEGVIRVVYATTNHYDVIENDEILTLIFKPRKSQQSGEIGLNLQGTGVIADQYGREPEGVYLLIPKIYVQGVQSVAELDFTAYPNPFSDKITISYTLPESGGVSLKVYNVLGELVTDFINQTQSAGKYSVDFPGNKLPEGIYTFRMEYESRGVTRSTMLKVIK